MHMHLSGKFSTRLLTVRMAMGSLVAGCQQVNTVSSILRTNPEMQLGNISGICMVTHSLTKINDPTPIPSASALMDRPDSSYVHK